MHIIFGYLVLCLGIFFKTKIYCSSLIKIICSYQDKVNTQKKEK